jgi:hypothetical protein
MAHRVRQLSNTLKIGQLRTVKFKRPLIERLRRYEDSDLTQENFKASPSSRSISAPRRAASSLHVFSVSNVAIRIETAAFAGAQLATATEHTIKSRTNIRLASVERRPRSSKKKGPRFFRARGPAVAPGWDVLGQ